ncbi:MAG: AAA family ATPase [Deltaproteobacteria bacterium]|jgi:CO dehydrogenase maturation factor|nr:AAA family ATPase [Deltaproteobacteria bacterium]MDX2497444.1 AAA family ATPase [Desulfobacterales bacterium]MBW1968782.1 AAA family ATPase [Deltaproteobacteria bacterium]MBW2155849.1 AAA family ATPase [Deltaproteobacteria bacterium]MBW2197947.1 AAA family ATPase [Deltaproteobacteria bacterium]
MPFSIALAGKGGTGKTTLAGLLIKYLVKTDRTPILAVDADSNANLNEVCGLEVTDTLGNAREEMRKGIVPSGMTKDIFMNMKLQQAVVEDDGFDLIVMGRPEGPGCYCAANTLLTGFLEKLTGNYPYIVMDNEAGMEHISRLTTNNVDILLITSDTSRRALQAAIRINDLAKDLNIGVSKSYLIINQVKETPSDTILNIIKEKGLELAGTIPEDYEVYEYDLNGRPTIELPEDNTAVLAAYEIFDKIIE